MHITPQDGSTSNKKKDKDLAFKASQEKGKARLEYESSSDEEDGDESLALMVKKTAKMLKKLNKNGIKFDGKKRSSSLAQEGSQSLRWIAPIVENFVI